MIIKKKQKLSTTTNDDIKESTRKRYQTEPRHYLTLDRLGPEEFYLICVGGWNRKVGHQGTAKLHALNRKKK